MKEKKVKYSVNLPILVFDKLKEVKENDKTGISFNRVIVSCIIAGLKDLHDIEF